MNRQATKKDARKNNGGKREGAGRPPMSPDDRSFKPTRSIRCTLNGWEWLQSQAKRDGCTSIGAWADAKAAGELKATNK